MNDPQSSDFLGDDDAGPRSVLEVSRFWRAFFWIAAVFGLVLGLAGMLSPEATIDARIIGLLIFSLGIVYFQVAREPLRFAPVLWAGVLCKIGVIALLAPLAFEGGSLTEPLLAGGLIAEALFALGFLVFLLTVADAAVS